MTYNTNNIVRRAFLILCAAMLTACVRNRPSDSEITSPASVQFVNESLESASVFAVAAGGVDEEHLGVAMPGERREFTIPADVLRRGSGTIRIVAFIPALGRRRNSGPIQAGQSDFRVILPKGASQLIVEVVGTQ